MTPARRGRVAHVVPGRIRVTLSREDLTPEFGRELSETLTALPGISGVRVAPLTGSVVIRYDRAATDPATVLEAVRAAGLLSLDPLGGEFGGTAAEPVVPSLTARRLHDAFHDVDVRLAEITNGRWDLRSVFPASLGVLALRRLLAAPGQLGAAPWYVLAWYAFDAYWKLNESGPEFAGTTPGAAGAPEAGTPETQSAQPPPDAPDVDRSDRDGQ
jgi:Heavy metal associated domain 2